MFDSKEARKAGIDNDIIKLAEELVNYQNNLVEDLREGKARIGDKVKPSPQKYPRLRKFHQRAADKFKKTKASSFKLLNPGNEEKLLTFDTNFYAVNTETACGNYAFPKPNKAPVRYFYNQSNPAPSSWLLNNGFHVTASYATGNYQNNYTRETFYSGVQGTCDSPKFRDDGTAGNGTTSNGAFYNMNIQYKEPNPEILELYYGLWSYLGWGTYVQWWHNTY